MNGSLNMPLIKEASELSEEEVRKLVTYDFQSQLMHNKEYLQPGWYQDAIDAFRIRVITFF